MAAESKLFEKEESIFIRRTVSREIKDGTVVHKRLVRESSFDVFGDGPSFERLASGLHAEIDPGQVNMEDKDRLPSFFKVNIHGKDEDSGESLLKVCVRGLVRILGQNHRLQLAIEGMAAEVDWKRREVSSWKRVEILYAPYHRRGDGWFMEETIAPLPYEPVDWDWGEVTALLRGRLGTTFRLYDSKKNSATEYRIVEEGNELIDDMRAPIENWGHTIAIGLSQKKNEGEWVYYDRPHVLMLGVPPRDKPRMTPYLLENGELHLTTTDGWEMTFFAK